MRLHDEQLLLQPGQPHLSPHNDNRHGLQSSQSTIALLRCIQYNNGSSIAPTVSQGPSSLISAPTRNTLVTTPDRLLSTDSIDPAMWSQLDTTATTTMTNPDNFDTDNATPMKALQYRAGSSDLECLLETTTPDANEASTLPTLNFELLPIQKHPVPEGSTYLDCLNEIALTSSTSLVGDQWSSSVLTPVSWPQLSVPPSSSAHITTTSLPSTHAFQRPSTSWSYRSVDNGAVTNNCLPRSPSVLERHQPQLPHNDTTHSSLSSYLTNYMTKLGKSPNPPRVCHICRKQYANNSTLRRHHKIHAYANSAARALALLRGSSHSPFTPASASPAAAFSTTTSATVHANPPVLYSSLPSSSLDIGERQQFAMAPGPSASAVMSTLSTPSEPAPMLAMTAPVGYNLRSDPDIKKPECVGCNKAFARRDTVILHMKNQKRKWDLLCTMLPRLIETTSAPSAQRKGAHGIGRHSTDACATWAESDSPWEQSGSSNVTAPTVTTNPTAGRSSATDPQGAVVSRHKPQKQRRSHPYRMVEKLWHSTLQKRACLLGLVHSPSTIHVKKGEDASHITTAGPFHEELDWRVEGEDLLATLANGTNGDEGDDGDENEWLGLQGLSPLGAQAKLIWMMKVMEEPPCWKERKVRMFGAYGVLEEKVLQ